MDLKTKRILLKRHAKLFDMVTTFQYEYCLYNPLISTDPLGEFSVIADGKIKERIRRAVEELCNRLLPKFRNRRCNCLLWAGPSSGRYPVWPSEIPHLFQCLSYCCKTGKIIYEGAGKRCKRGDLCGYATRLPIFGVGRCVAHLCLLGYDEGSGCGGIGATVAHEWIHSCGYPGEEGPNFVTYCLYGYWAM